MRPRSAVAAPGRNAQIFSTLASEGLASEAKEALAAWQRGAVARGAASWANELMIPAGSVRPPANSASSRSPRRITPGRSRPSSAGPLPAPCVEAAAGLPLPSMASLSRPVSAGRLPPPCVEAAAGPPLPSMAPLSEPLLAERGPPPPLPPLPKYEFSLAGIDPRCGGRVEESIDEDFTVEEIRLEKEVEQALTELEAADATVTALRMQLENATEDVATTRRELLQLRGVVSDWEKATGEGRRELTERESRVEELLAALPAELLVSGAFVESGAPEDGGAEEGLAEDIRLSPRRRRLDLTTDRVRVLEGQTARLEEQVVHRQIAAESSMAERRKLEQQAESLERERDFLRSGLREARGEVRELELRLKRRDEVLVATAQKRQTLERQQAHSRAEVNGLHARLASLAASKASSEATPLPRAPSAIAPAPSASSTAAEASSTALALPGEDARAVSLRLQREIVDLWAQLRCCDEAAAGKSLEVAKGAASTTVMECAAAGG